MEAFPKRWQVGATDGAGNRLFTMMTAADQGQSAPSAAALRQAEFDGETKDTSNVLWI